MFRVDELVEATKGKLINLQLPRTKVRGLSKVDTETLSSSGLRAGFSSGECINEARGITARGISIDSRTIKPQDVFIAIKGNNFDGHDFINEAITKGASCVFKEPGSKAKDRGRNVPFIEVKDTIKALADIAIFQRKKFNIPVIAITGSNGKTTTKEMVARVLSGKFNVLKNEGTKNNQIGLSLALLNLNSSHDIAVLEAGTNHPGEIEYLAGVCQPNICVITNIGPSHLEYLHNLGGVFKEKYKLVENLVKPYIGILNADDNLLKSKISPKHAKTVIFGFGMKNSCDFSARLIKNDITGFEFCVNKKYKFRLKTPGHYNIYNALAAITVARILGLAYKDIIYRLNTFDFPQSRLKFKEINSVKFIDDTYNSNPLSLSLALNALANFRIKGRKIFVMGDMLELGKSEKSFHYQAGRQAARCCDVFITVGNLSKAAARGALASCFDTRNIFTCQTIDQARRILFDKLLINRGDLILVKGSRRMKMDEVFKG